ncbi:membrane integrity-associated transporter subunit PqiC [Ningiella sp. W23]|uniref:PqiC family protein n=1 Tax=Ningiella sp. W23 TaxID=3023715 RepID=UPI003758108B
MIVRVLSIFLLFSLAACSSVQPLPKTQHYLLDTALSADADTIKVAKAKVTVVDVPDYLKQSSLVMVNSNNAMQIAQYHRWANRVSDSISSALSADINATLSDSAAYSSCTECIVVNVHIEHFYPTQEGDVHFTGYFQIAEFIGSPNQVVSNDITWELTDTTKHRFNLQAEMDKDGYGEAVSKMRKLVSQLAKRVIETLPAEPA